MLLRFRINRPSNVMKGLPEKLIEQAWAALAEARRTLAANPAARHIRRPQDAGALPSRGGFVSLAYPR